MPIRSTLPLVAALTVIACGSEPADETQAAPAIAEADAPAASDTSQAAAPATKAIADDRIPARYHGAWDDVAGDCNPFSDLRMEIGSDEIMFYESMGRVTSVERAGEGILVELAMEGEGESWDQRTRFVVEGSGDDERLITLDENDADGVDPYPSKRCPS
ncbi:hypothetical protein [Erythrobacter sp.]|jgi:hypothetical protein|uniref:hypothetical protein n=1 Tax=Erythrobacter sp. TaxID=1042 RepID=UPI002EBAC967|nr:hypothetical protein [Erythrobacter sp.]